MNLLRNHDWSLPVPIAYGPGRVGQMAEFCRGAGMRKPLLVTDKGSEALPIIGRVLDALEQGVGTRTVVPPRRFDQRDRPGKRAPVAVDDGGRQ